MICVDASLAAKWILEEEESDRARALYRSTLQMGEPIVAPPLLPVEMTNILRQRRRAADGLTRDEAHDLLEVFLAFPIAVHNPAGLHQQALILADHYTLPATYDAYYVALAEILHCDLWTADERLLKHLSGKAPFVKALAAYTP
jgi:predicted nucleic acid-binding protein